MKLATLEAVLAAQARGERAAILTDLADGRQALVIGGEVLGMPTLGESERALAMAAVASGRSRLVETAGERLFIQVVAPPPRLILVGAVHIAEVLAPMAALAGWSAIIIDPRQRWRQRGGFAGCHVVGDWPDTALAALAPDAETAVVTLTHDPKLDDPALLAALASPAFYVGALGSRRTHGARLARLAAAGVAEAARARLHAPVGLAIGALTPAEIAVSILAEIIAVRRGALATGGGG
jgi:xanthine dehydrogenase accessory factor